MTATERAAYIATMKRHGIAFPVRTLEEAQRAGLRLSRACALLAQETAGGKNVWGGDRAPNGGTTGWQWKTVTEADYRAYKRRRGSTGQGGRQGVGPGQLTWHTLQDAADKLGGCWEPRWNMRVAFEHFQASVKQHGFGNALEIYNTGRTDTAKGAAYRRSVEALAEKWRDLLNTAGEPDPPEQSPTWRALDYGDKGADVGMLQTALNGHAKRKGLWPITVDKAYGPQSHGLAVEVVYRLGVGAARITGGRLSVYSHRRVVEPKLRSPEQLEREKTRDAEAVAAAKLQPKIVRAQFTTRAVFGGLGHPTRFTVHYSAGSRAKTLAEGLRDAEASHRFHASKGWGGCSYHFIIPDSGEIILCRPVGEKGAGVAGQNSGNVHAQFPGTTGDRPTPAQKRAIQWLVAHAHTDKLPRSHRTSRDLRRTDIRGHNEWPGQSTGCPGHFTPRNLGIKNR